MKGLATSTCRSCRARILWCQSANGKAIPMDPDPVADGNMYIDSEGVARTIDLFAAGDVERYVAHFATCPDADEHRKARP